MALEFPDSPTAGQRYQPGRNWKFTSPVWNSEDNKTLLRNRLVNPAMQISQQHLRGAVSGLVAAGSGYPADQWVAGWNFLAARP